MTTAGLAAFLLASFLLAIVPGVGTAMLVKQSLRGGRRAAFATVAGLQLGVAFWAVAAGLGLSVLLVASEVAYHALRVVGVVVAPEAGQHVLLTLAALWVIIDTVWYLIIATLLTKVIGWLKRHQHKLERLTGAVLIGLGVKLALDR